MFLFFKEIISEYISIHFECEIDKKYYMLYNFKILYNYLIFFLLFNFTPQSDCLVTKNYKEKKKTQ